MKRSLGICDGQRDSLGCQIHGVAVGARQMEQGYVAPTPAEKPVTREVVPPTRAQARKEGEDLPLYGKIEL